MKNDAFIPVILSGGEGTRLWPLSRESHPKQFIPLQDGQSLLAKTFLRAQNIPSVTEIISVTNTAYYFKSMHEYDRLAGELPCRFILEPYAKNTAAALALVALKVEELYGLDAVLLVLPADHSIENEQGFREDCRTSIKLARKGFIVTLGVKPLFPETGYGYIEVDHALSDQSDCYLVKRFVEKPNVALARKYCQDEHYFWNTGIYCFSVKTILEEFTAYAPEIVQQAKLCLQTAREENQHMTIFVQPEQFYDFQSISIDYALMEKSKKLVMVQNHFAWQDIGSWEAYKKLFPNDENGNTVLTDSVLIDAKDNLILGATRLIAAIGVNNLAIIDTPDALLIAPRNSSQAVKAVVQQLKEKAHDSYLTYRTVSRPWGEYTILEEGPKFKIKRLVVKPHMQLSLQSHQYRSEHWIVVEGTASITNGDEVYELQTSESTFVARGVAHRLANNSDQTLIIIEIQTGDYLHEDDIVCHEDNLRLVGTDDLKIPHMEIKGR